MNKLRAFTLIELLVVIAIIAILAAILFPVFAQARKSAKQSTCANNFSQMAKAMEMYKSDNGSKYPLVDYFPGSFRPPDKWWSQLVHPYVRSKEVLACASDPNQRAEDVERTWNTDQPCPAADQACKDYGRFHRTNFGINWQYLAAMLASPNTTVSTKDTAVAHPSQTILGVDSVYKRDLAGKPYMGGKLIVDPPARFAMIGGIRVDTFRRNSNFYWVEGWNPNKPLSEVVFGNAWPWHGELFMVAYCDTHVKPQRGAQLAAGCDVKPQWAGIIYDIEAYQWDTF